MDVNLLFLIALAVLALYFYLTKNYNYWKKRGIPSAPSPFPGVGHILPVVLLQKNMGCIVNDLYNSFRKHSMYGYFELREPVLAIREPELVKTVMLTAFPSFHENAFEIDASLDPLIAKNPFFCSGETWQSGRKRLTYAFSSMRLRILSTSVQGVCKKLENYVNAKLKAKGTYEVELKDLFSRYTGEVVANAGFGVEGFCFEDKLRPDAFVSIGKSIFDPTFTTGLFSIMFFFMPGLSKILGTKFVSKENDKFFRDLVKQVLEARRTESVPRNDFFQLMVDLEKTEGTQVDEETVTCHALSFFVDGFETSSITLCFIGYFLATRKDVQEKLRAEVKSVLAKHDGAITYECVRDMTYMDQVISESQRVIPAVGNLAKKCTTTFQLKGSDGLECTVEKGTKIIIPLGGLQNDPDYWTDPESFDPDRFNDEKKSAIIKYSFLPFGEGPRICVGMRMALLQVKSCLASILNNYELELSPKTQEPLRWNPYHFLRVPIGGIWVKIKAL